MLLNRLKLQFSSHSVYTLDFKGSCNINKIIVNAMIARFILQELQDVSL